MRYNKTSNFLKLQCVIVLLMPVLFINNIYCQRGTEGYYKDLFMDGGVNLTSKTYLPAANYLGLSMEYLATASSAIQSSVLISNINDQNGVLLYPDGEPRFRHIYTNGGGATDHGSSLGEEGREIIRTFFNNGGTYSGSCAGAFIVSLSPDTTKLREEYYHIWPGYVLSCKQTKIYTGHFLTLNSPLLDYYDFGGDNYVDNVYHNGGGFAYEHNIPIGTEILARYDYPGSYRMHMKPSVWAYRDPDKPESGRLVVIGSHPESVSSGERLDLMSAIIQYALDGQGKNHIKAALNDGETRVMDKSTYENDPDYTKIGDRQYHHFTVDIPEGTSTLTVSLTGDDNYDLSLYVNRDDFAFNSENLYNNTTEGANKTLTINNLTAGTYYISVECITTVNSLMRSEYYEYTKNLDVLNGVAYTIQAELNAATDINKIDIKDFEVYPNPFSRRITLKMRNNSLIEEVNIIDLSGNIVFKQEIRNALSDIIIEPSNNLVPGIYYLRIRTANQVYVKKILKIAN